MFSYGVRLVSMAVSVITLIGAPVPVILTVVAAPPAAVVAAPLAAVVAAPPAAVVAAPPAAVVAAAATVVAEPLDVLLSLPQAGAVRPNVTTPISSSPKRARSGERVLDLKMYPPRWMTDPPEPGAPIPKRTSARADVLPPSC